jgi:hypothetical protein
MTSVGVIVLFLAWASSAYASLNSAHINEIIAENARLKSQITLLKTENARSKNQLGQQAMEIKRLKTEIERRIEPAVAVQTHFDGHASVQTGDTDEFEVMADIQATKTCPGRCQNKCFMSPNHFDQSCTLKEDKFKLEISKSRIRSVGTPSYPKWSLHAGGVKQSFLGNVSCPCISGNQVLSEYDAVRRIVGQVAAMGYPDVWAKRVCNARNKGKRALEEGFWNMKVTVATIFMLECWKKKCAAPGNNEAASDAYQLDVLLNEDVDQGAGWNCG